MIVYKMLIYRIALLHDLNKVKMWCRRGNFYNWKLPL